MRVLLIGDYPPPFGGVAIHVQQLHRFLREHGVEVRGLDIGKGTLPAPEVRAVRSASALARELFGFQRGVVHLHTSGHNPKAWLVAAAVGALRPPRAGPRYITVHSGLLPAYLARSTGRRALTRAALTGFAGVIAVSEAVAEALRSCGVASSRIHVYPAFLASQVRPGDAPPGLDTARGRRRPLLVYAHHPSPVYGRTLLFAAVRRLLDRMPALGVAIFGPGTRAPELREEARASGVDGCLEDFGELEHAQALALMARGDVYVRPTLADGDAISVREALELGVPCVASDAAVRPEGAVTYRSRSEEGLVDAVVRALARGPLRVRGPDAGPFLLSRYSESHPHGPV
ncbi:MAG: glycosyltransferase [Myxococcaceae bacterium]|nr:glycosyltransferase [Myxococcaceae bacterium]